MRPLFLIFILTLTFSQTIHAQFGGALKTLKDKATKEAKDKANEKANDKIDKSAEEGLAEAEKDYDPASFKFAISFVDNSGLFEAREKYDKHKKVLLAGIKDADIDVFHLGREKDKLKNSLSNAKDDAKPDADDAIDKGTDAVTHLRTGELLYASSKYDVAEFEFDRAKNLMGNKPSDPNYARLESDYGLLYQTQGRYTEAAEHTDKALELRQKYAPNSPEYAVSLNNKGVLLKELSEYLEAEKYLKESKKINAEQVGKESLAYAINLNNIAMLYHELGRYSEAEDLMDECLSVAEKSLGNKSSNFIRLRINKAIILRDNNKYSEAEQIYLEAIKVKEARLGKKHPDYAQLKSGLAALYMEMGKMDQVEENLKTAAEIFEKKFGENHPSYATTMFELGHFYRIQGDLNQSESKLTKALEIRKKVLGENHPEYLNTQEELAILKWQKGDISTASRDYDMVIDRTMEYVNAYFSSMSEKEKTRLWDKLRERLFRYYSFSIATRADNSASLEKMLNLHISTKGLLLNSTNKIKNAILNSDDNTLKAKYLSWLRRKENLARLYTYSKEELKEEKIDLPAMEVETNDLERELTQMSSEFSEAYKIQTTDYKTIQKLLGSSEALVEIVEFHKYDKKFVDENTYAIFVIKNTGSPSLVLKENGKYMDTKGSKFYKNAVKFGLSDSKSYNTYWSGIDTEIADKSDVYVSLDGVYNQINPNTLKTPSGSFLIDEKKLIFINSSKDIINLKENQTSATQKTATLIGNPHFGSEGRITKLPGTKTEVESIEKLIGSKYKTTTYVEKNATEANLKKSNPTILHIATHGFFLSDVDISKSSRTLGVESSKAKENPLLRSGLMLANAESVFDTNNVNHSSTNNGILTAYEAMNMDLSNTDLVVISACETGLGDIKVGEGVYGLQRSFQVAGANSLIMSLWKVDDNSTQQLMSQFYSNLRNGMSKSDAFRKAQMSIKEKFPEVKYWGALILLESE